MLRLLFLLFTIQTSFACHDLWYNKCINDNQCCSKYCDRPKYIEFGVCKPASYRDELRPTSPKNCHDNFYNYCKLNHQCCSNYCDLKENQEFGVCKPSVTTVPETHPCQPSGHCGDEQKECLQDQMIGCDRLNCCSNLTCYFGPDDSWKKGICLEQKTKNLSTLKNWNDDDDYLDEYKNYVQNILFKMNNEIFPSTALKCRDLDPLGQYFYNLNDKYSFRICDACKEFPMNKLEEIRIDGLAFEELSPITFPECFEKCFERQKCVAFNYDKVNRICALFDKVTGDFQRDESWNAIIMSQPVDFLRDYVYSRHTNLICESNATISLKVGNMLECFGNCEEYQCQASVYYNKTCVIYLPDQSCTEIHYQYGIVSLFHQEFFEQNNDWRFIADDSSESIIEEDKLMTEPEKLKVNYKDSRLSPKISDNMKKLLKLKEQHSDIIKCYNECVEMEACTGIVFDNNDSTCKILDWDVYNSYQIDAVLSNIGFTHILLNPKRDKTIYGFDLQINISLAKITYHHKMVDQSVTTCLNDCKTSKHFTNQECIEVFFNLEDKTCFLIGQYETDFMENIENSRLNILNFRKNRPNMKQDQFKFALIGSHKVMTNEYNRFLIKNIVLENHKHSGLSPMEFCFKECNSMKDKDENICQLLQVIKGKMIIECKFYRDIPNNGMIQSFDIHNGDIYIRILPSEFTVETLNRLPIFSKNDAKYCKLDQESIQDQLVYLSKVKNNSTTLVRNKRFFGKIFNFFKDVGKAVVDTIVDTGTKIVDTTVGTAKTVGSLVKGDLKGAKKHFEELPVVQDAKDLYKNVKQIGEGVVKGDFKKIGEGLLNVATNDLVPFPGGPLTKVGKNVGKTMGKKLGKGQKKVKDKIKDVNKKKNKSKDKDKDKKDDKDKNRKCKNKPNKRVKRAKKRPRDECDDDNTCEIPRMTKTKSKTNVIESTINNCKNTKINQRCYYLCNPGFDEQPDFLTCSKKGDSVDWNALGKCVKQNCGTGNKLEIQVKAPGALYKHFDKRKEIILYIVLYDVNKKLTEWSVTYYNFHVNRAALKSDKRVGPFYQHPCLGDNQQMSDGDYKLNQYGYEKGHLSPADLFRWNEKTKRSANLYINTAPQIGSFNKGSWKSLETRIQCAAKNKINAIVATGTATGPSFSRRLGKSHGHVPEYFWKMVCYRRKGDSTTHVVLFIGSNNLKGSKEDESEKKFTKTPRDQKNLFHNDHFKMHFNAHNPWMAAQKMFLNNKFNLINRYPIPTECMNKQTLDENEKTEWKRLFNQDDLPDIDKLKIGGIKRKRKERSASSNLLCSDDELREFLAWKSTDFSQTKPDEDEENNEDHSNEDSIPEVNIPTKSCGKRIVGYYPSWGETEVKASTLAKFTHIIFAFFEMKSDGIVRLGNPDHSSAKSNDEVEALARYRLNSLLSNRKILPNLKILFAIGGWENSQYFSKMASSENLRQNFYSSILKIIDDFGFDGIDIDWEYPVTGGATDGILQDKENYVTLLRELRNILDDHANNNNRDKYLITFASAAGETALNVGYNLPELLKYADWVNVMTYDYFGPWTSKWGAYTGPPAPLYHGVPKGYSGKFNVNWSIKQYVCKLKSPSQVVMGIPLYGRYWHNVPAKSGKHSMFRLANSVNGKFEGGFVSWKDINNGWIQNSGFEFHFDDVVKSSYAYNQNGTYLGYESPESVKHKIDFAIKSNLGGLMVWAIDQDDEDSSMITPISSANLCTNDQSIKFKCVPIDEKRWWTLEDGDDKAGLCGKSAPLYKGYYPVCDPDDYGYSCCGEFGYCGSEEFCACPTCINYAENPDKITEEPTKPVAKITWHFSNAPDGQRMRCGRNVPKVNGEFATCNSDDPNAHCCSSGGYCGNSQSHCQCSGCINFKNNKNFRFRPKTWWDWNDGPKSGKCGRDAPRLENGGEAGCDPDSEYYCCSDYGSCGSGSEFCDCEKCKNFRN